MADHEALLQVDQQALLCPDQHGEDQPSVPDRVHLLRQGHRCRLAEQWLANIKTDMSRGAYVDPAAGRTTFRQYGEKWIAAQTTDMTTRTTVEVQLRLHAFPHIGTRPLGSFKPEHIREWLGVLENPLPKSSYRRVIFNTVSAVLTAAVEDGHLLKNPCRATSVRAPLAATPRVRPWTAERVFAVRSALPARYRAMADVGGGCGLRQGEIFGLSESAVNGETGWVHVDCQVKVVNGHLVFSPPKRGKERTYRSRQRGPCAQAAQRGVPVRGRDAPLAPAGRPLVTKRLLFSLAGGGAVRRTDFNTRVWKFALVAAGVLEEPRPGERHQAAREHGMHALRYFYASVLLDAGENVKALSTYLGHGDPGFTLRTYTHLMPSSEGRTWKALDGLYKASSSRRTTQGR
ncbi:tyrosine-type recombinase/integrase [Streptomyces sp. NPDC087297]|uniref:tyrosine-type recombinase/integrase n=1 Tax=Streptomyces sp. NPDC087297 TaxID=3365778 RepID=UPI003819AB60